MSERELLEHYKNQCAKAQYYLHRYIDELKLHFGLEDNQILKIFEKERKILKSKNFDRAWFNFFKNNFLK